MFTDSVVHVGGKQKYTLLVSIVAHTLVIAAATIVPLVATDTIVLPRFTMISIYDKPPLPPSPPPPRGAPGKQPPIVERTVPVEPPQGIMVEIPIRSTGEPLADITYTTGIVDGGDYSVAPPPAPPAAPSNQAPLRVGGDIKAPVKVFDSAPVYPALARAARVQGIVIIEATIGPNGKVRDARILRSIALLDAAALDAVRQWEYTPTLLNGVPIAIVMTVTVDFRLR
jgi:protein TonB